MKNILLMIVLIAFIFVGCGSDSSTGVIYSTGDTFTLTEGQTINSSNNANVTITTDVNTGITTVVVNSGSVTLN